MQKKFFTIDIIDEMMIECWSKEHQQILIALLATRGSIAPENINGLLSGVMYSGYQSFQDFDLSAAIRTEVIDRTMNVHDRSGSVKKLYKRLSKLPNKVHLQRHGMFYDRWRVIPEEEFDKLLSGYRNDLAIANRHDLHPEAYCKVSKCLHVSVVSRVDYSIETALRHTDIPGYILQMIDEYVTQEFGKESKSSQNMTIHEQ